MISNQSDWVQRIALMTNHQGRGRVTSPNMDCNLSLSLSISLSLNLHPTSKLLHVKV